jgi:hypothetical protein
MRPPDSTRAGRDLHFVRHPEKRAPRIRDGLWIAEVVNDDGGGQVYDVAMILELKDGKIWRDRRYDAEPFEAPAWRAEWFERVEL